MESVVAVLHDLVVKPQFEKGIRAVQEKFFSANDSRELKRLTRCLTSNEQFLLQDCRIIDGHGVRLRDGPSLKHEVLAHLPNGKIIAVIDSSRRSWLQVEVNAGGDILLGWVYRRYTTRPICQRRLNTDPFWA